MTTRISGIAIREPDLYSEVVTLIEVHYTRLRTDDGGDLYLTCFGLPFRKHLAPWNWYESEWFDRNRVRLAGTSAIYKVRSKAVENVSIELVVRFSRVGLDVILDPQTFDENPQAEFNSPFEEFALLMRLRNQARDDGHPRVLTKKPLAIYVPTTRLKDWQTGRQESKMAAKRAHYPDAALDSSKQYILIYGWIDGVNAVEASGALAMSGTAAEQFQAQMTLRVVRDLKRSGFRVVDMKPEHIILRFRRDGSLLRQRDGNPAYALVDYELLELINESV
jgi:hypothetical protein